MEEARRGSTSHAAVNKEKGNRRPLINQVKQPKCSLLPILTPTVPTRALNLRAKRHFWLRHNGAVVPTPHTSCLKMGALKSYVRVVPSKASGARPPVTPEPRIRAAHPAATNLKPLEVKIPRPWPPTILEVARLTHQVGSNSRLKITEQGMTKGENNRGHGPNP